MNLEKLGKLRKSYSLEDEIPMSKFCGVLEVNNQNQLIANFFRKTFAQYGVGLKDTYYFNWQSYAQQSKTLEDLENFVALNSSQNKIEIKDSIDYFVEQGEIPLNTAHLYIKTKDEIENKDKDFKFQAKDALDILLNNLKKLEILEKYGCSNESKNKCQKQLEEVNDRLKYLVEKNENNRDFIYLLALDRDIYKDSDYDFKLSKHIEKYFGKPNFETLSRVNQISIGIDSYKSNTIDNILKIGGNNILPPHKSELLNSYEFPEIDNYFREYVEEVRNKSWKSDNIIKLENITVPFLDHAALIDNLRYASNLTDIKNAIKKTFKEYYEEGRERLPNYFFDDFTNKLGATFNNKDIEDYDEDERDYYLKSNLIKIVEKANNIFFSEKDIDSLFKVNTTKLLIDAIKGFDETKHKVIDLDPNGEFEAKIEEKLNEARKRNSSYTTINYLSRTLDSLSNNSYYTRYSGLSKKEKDEKIEENYIPTRYRTSIKNPRLKSLSGLVEGLVELAEMKINKDIPSTYFIKEEIKEKFFEKVGNKIKKSSLFVDYNLGNPHRNISFKLAEALFDTLAETKVFENNDKTLAIMLGKCAVLTHENNLSLGAMLATRIIHHSKNYENTNACKSFLSNLKDKGYISEKDLEHISVGEKIVEVNGKRIRFFDLENSSWVKKETNKNYSTSEREFLID